MTGILDEAARAFKARDFLTARELFREATAADPGNGKAWFFLGQAYAALGQTAEAMAAFQQAIAGDDPRVAPLAHRAADALLERTGRRPTPTMELAPPPGLPTPPPPAPEPAPAAEAQPEPIPEPMDEPTEEPAPEPEQGPERPTWVLCPACGMPIPEARQASPWCACGYGQPAEEGPIDRLPLAVFTAYQRAAKGAIELNVRNDHYTLAGRLKVKQLSARATDIDPRLVFPTERGAPYLRREDFGGVKNDEVKDAVFGLGFNGYFSWDDGLAEFERVLGSQGLRPTTSLASLLLDFGGLTEAQLAEAREHQGGGTLGEALMAVFGWELEDLVTAALGARVATPTHHGANELGHRLLARGVVSEPQLAKAVVAQLSARKPIQELLGGEGLPPGEVKAIQEELRQEPWPTPARDDVGEHLYQRGLLTRTDLALVERDVQEKGGDPVAMLLGRGKVDARALERAKKFVAMKQHLRREGMIRLGEVLVKQQACSPAAVAEALRYQVTDPRPLGAMLVAMGACAPEHVVFALDEQEAALDALTEKVLADRERKAQAVRPPAAPPAKKASKFELDRRVVLAAMAVVVLAGAGLGVQRYLAAKAHQEELMQRLDALLAAKPPLLAEAPQGISKELAAALAAQFDKPGPVLTPGDLATARRKAPTDVTQVADLLGPKAPSMATKPLRVDDDLAVDAFLPIPPEPSGGERLLALGRPADALAALAADTSPHAALVRAKALRLLEQPAKAREAILATKAGEQDAQLALARSAAQAGKADEALAAYAKLPADLPAARLGRAGVLLAGGQEEEARKALAEVLVVDSSNGPALAALGRLELATDPQAGLEHLLEASEALTKELDAARARWASSRDKGRPLMWIAELQGAAATDARLADAFDGLQQALASRDPERAAACAKRAVATYRSATRPLVELGDAYANMGGAGQAVQAWTVAARLAPFNPVPVARLAVLARQQGRGDAASRLAELAVARAPK